MGSVLTLSTILLSFLSNTPKREVQTTDLTRTIQSNTQSKTQAKIKHRAMNHIIE